MTKTEILKSLIMEQRAEQRSIDRTPGLLRVLFKRKYKGKQVKLLETTDKINEELKENEYYMPRNSHFYNLQSISELEEERQQKANQLKDFMCLFLTKTPNNTVEFDYEMTLYPLMKYPELQECGDYYTALFHGTIMYANQAYLIGNDSYIVTGDDIRQLGEEFGVEKMKEFNPDLNALPNHIIISNMSDNPLARRHL